MGNNSEELHVKRIQEFSDDELVHELADRYECFVLAGRKRMTVDGKKVQRRRYWSGDYDACVGLVHGVGQDILNANWGVKAQDIIEGD